MAGASFALTDIDFEFIRLALNVRHSVLKFKCWPFDRLIDELLDSASQSMV